MSDGSRKPDRRRATLVLISRTGERHPRRRRAGAHLRRQRARDDRSPSRPGSPSVHTRGNRRDARVSPGDAVGRRDRGLCRGRDGRAHRLRRAPGRPVAGAGAGAARRARRTPTSPARACCGATASRSRRAGGGFSSARYAFALESGTIATTLPPERRPVLWVDRRAFAARRDALLATGPPHWSAGDTLAEADWGWRLSLTGHRVICSPILIPIDEGVGPPRTRRRSRRKACACAPASRCSPRCSETRRSTVRSCRTRRRPRR